MLEEWLKEALRTSGVSGSELARQLTARLGRSIDPAAVSKMQKGIRRIAADEMLLISEITKAPPVDMNAASITHVPLISFVSAGGFCDPGYVDHEADAPKIEVAGLPRGKWIALRVEGDSMDRVSAPGSIIIVNTQDKELAPNAFYVVANEAHEATYKRFRPNPDRFEPMSTNPNHEAIFPQGEIKIIGRVKRSILEL